MVALEAQSFDSLRQKLKIINIHLDMFYPEQGK